MGKLSQFHSGQIHGNLTVFLTKLKGIWKEDYILYVYWVRILLGQLGSTRILSAKKISDIKVKEQTVENMMKNKPIYEPPRFMTNQQAAEQLMEIVKSKENSSKINVMLLILVLDPNQSELRRINWRYSVCCCGSSWLA